MTVSLGKIGGTRQVGNKGRMAMLGKRVGRERGTGRGASQARRARKVGRKRQERVKRKVMVMVGEEKQEDV